MRRALDQAGRGFGLSAEGISAPTEVGAFSARSPLGYDKGEQRGS